MYSFDLRMSQSGNRHLKKHLKLPLHHKLEDYVHTYVAMNIYFLSELSSFCTYVS